MPSPLCEVRDGAGSYQSTTNGVNVTPGNTVTIHLIDSSAETWSIECVYTDDLSVAATVNAGLSINGPARTASFTAPSAGRAYIFRSVVNGGVGPDGRTRSSYTTTFGIYTLTSGGARVLASNETTESDATFGWIKPINSLIRSGGGGEGGATPGGSEGQAQYHGPDGTLAGSEHLTFDEDGYPTIEEPVISAPIVTGGMTVVDASGNWQYLVSPGTLAGDRIVFLPVLTGNDTFVMASVSQTLANKTLTAPTFGVASSTAFRVRNPTGTFNYLFQPTAIAADRIITIPLLTNDDTLVFANFAATLLNKTLDAPTFSGLVTHSGSATHATGNAKGTAVDLNPVNVQTTDATQTTLDSFTSLSNSAVSVSWMVTAIKSDRSQAASYIVSAAFRNNGGTISQIGSTQVSGLEDDSNWAVAVDTSSGLIRLRVTGVAATTIQWVAIRTSLVVFP